MRDTLSPKHIYFDKSYYERQDQFASNEKYKSELDLLVELLKPDKRDLILDIGCSTGRAGQYLIKKTGCRVVGLDFPMSWLGQCRIIMCLRADAYYLPFKNCSFEKVYMLHVLGHVLFPGLILREVSRVLKSNGLLCMVNPNKYFVYSMRPLNYAKIIRYSPDRTILRYFSKSNIERMVKSSEMRLEVNLLFGNLPFYLKKWNNVKLLQNFKERIVTLARK